MKLFQVGVQFKSGVTGGESSHEDVDFTVIGLIVLEVGVDDFECVIVRESDLTDVVEVIGDQSEEMMSILNDFGGGFVKILSKLAPEAVEHEFGSGFASRILDDELGFEVDTFPLFV